MQTRNAGVISERPLGSGNFWIDYRANGKRHRERFKSRAAAREALDLRRRQIAEGTFASPRSRSAKPVTFRELAREAMQHKRKRISARSYATDLIRLEVVLERIGALAVQDLTPARLARLFLDLGDHGAQGQELAGGTLNRYRALISGIFRWAIAVGKLDRNPLADLPRYEESEGRVRYLREDEESRLRAVIRADCPEREPELDLAIATGMRLGEQFTLRWANVDRANRSALANGKSGERPIILGAPAIAALDRLEKQTGASEFVTPGATGPEQIPAVDWFARALKKAGVKNFRWHDLRHTFASRHAMSGTDILTISKLLGHASVVMTMKYAHLMPGHLHQAVDRAGSLLPAAPGS
jgi:integrase